jgi:hypothetical protein
MENVIQAIKFGNVINCSIRGKLYAKKFLNAEDADKMYREIINIKSEGSTTSQIDRLIGLFNVRMRAAQENGLELDPDTNRMYLPGHDTPIPKELVDLFSEYYEQGYPTQAIVNFWQLLATNPDEIVRERTFDFIRLHDFVITDNGYMVVYKAVYDKEEKPMPKFEYRDEVLAAVEKVRGWKKNINNHWIFVTTDGEFRITKSEEVAKEGVWNERLDIIYEQINSQTKIILPEDRQTVYTDMYTRSMDIRLGVPVYIQRTECDANHNEECSYGLHVGATKYVENFGRGSNKVLICLINPANIVAVPTYDRSKLRVNEYFPIGEAKYEDGKITAIQQPYFENDYINYERKELEKMLETIKVERKNPIKDAINAPKETRLFSELEGLIQNRLVTLNTV